MRAVDRHSKSVDHGVAHISGIRIAHVTGGERDVRVNRPEPCEGPIRWSAIDRSTGKRVRVGRGQSGLRYRLIESQGWHVFVEGGQGKSIQVGSARMHDHAQALASMWEHAVASGRIDMG